MKKTFFSACLALALGAGYASSALAQAKPELLVKQRQAAMTLISKYFGPLNGMAQGKLPYNAEVATRNAAFLDALSKMPWDGFNANTKDEKSAALPAVFNEPAKFKEAQDRFTSAVGKLASARDETGLKAAAGDVGKACAGCHDNFREKR